MTISRIPKQLHRRSAGLTLIEMMISIVIGMIVVVAIVAMYGGASGASRTAEAQGRMNEDAQAALAILSQELRMAGNNPKQANRMLTTPRNPVYTATTYVVRGCDGKFSNITAATNPQALTCAGTASTLPDSIAITYEADRFNSVPTTAGQPTNCVGGGLTTVTTSVTVPTTTGTVTASVKYHVADNRYYIGTSTVVTSPSLYCKGSNSSAQPLVENVEDLQFSYGTSPAGTSTGTVAGYLDAFEVATDTNADSTGASLASLASEQARWARVVAVRICVLVRSERPVLPDTSSAKYYGCGGTLVTSPPADGRLRRAYYTTIVLRNRI
jgi:type IV pilus assembly protein PilW